LGALVTLLLFLASLVVFEHVLRRPEVTPGDENVCLKPDASAALAESESAEFDRVGSA
jgi:hypothetical protein